MRLIRLLLLVLTIGVSYIAQTAFDQRHLSALFNVQVGSIGTLGDLLPGLSALGRMSPLELVTFGMFVTILMSLGFGLIASRWHQPLQRLRQVDAQNPTTSTGDAPAPKRAYEGTISITGLIITIVGLAFVLIVTAQVGTFGADAPPIHAVWLGGLILYFIGAIWVQRYRDIANFPYRQTDTESARPIQYVNGEYVNAEYINEGNLLETRPTAGWPLLLTILLSAMILYLWQLWRIPARIDHVVAEIGLQSLALLRGDTTGLFFPGATNLPMIAYVPGALMIQFTGDPLFGVRLSGVGSGLLMVLSTWLLCCELFRRVPRISHFGTILEDDGRWIALLAAMIIAFGHVTLYFSRLPVFLGPVAWGTLGLWAFLRGLRCQHLPTLTLSGMLIGLSSILYAGGLYFLLIVPLWWIGIWLIQRDWFYANDGLIGRSGENTRELDEDESSPPIYLGNENFLFWLGGLVVVMLPFLAIWLRYPTLFQSYLQSNYLLPSVAEIGTQALTHARHVDHLFLSNLRLTWFTFNIFSNSGSLLDIAAPFLNSWLAPLLFLGLGALILNLDRLPGWLILVSVFVGVSLGAVSLSVPFWLRLLSMMPFIAIVIAFAIDRIRIILLETAGTWLEQTTVYLAIGFLAWSSLQGWLTFYDYGLSQTASSSHVGRAMQSMPLEQTAVLLLKNDGAMMATTSLENDELTGTASPSGEANASTAQELNELQATSAMESILRQNNLDETVIEFIASDVSGPRKRIDVEIGQWPETLPPQVRILIQPDASDMIEEIKERYGEGELTPVRNLRGDPVLYIYDIW